MKEKDNPVKSFPIVGIGASAGGLEALQRFLGALPGEFNFALVFIQHLSPKHKSLLPELLGARRPSLVIQEISDGLKALPGRLYLAPAGREVRIKDGFFETTVHAEGLLHLPIDEFLSSLAEDAGERAVAVILSGAGTDGARGCQAVRTAGGTIYVQAPETAEFDAMPTAAIATGQADAVLSPEEICREVLKVEASGALAAGSVEVITPGEYDALFGLLLEKTGSRFQHYKKSVVSRRIRRRMYLHGLSTAGEYLGLVSARDNEAAALASDLMIGVTSFFRDRVAWKALAAEVVRKIAAENTDQPVRVWAPASATGEEAYSITMLLSHELALAGKKRDIQVFATDVNDRALERAREGKYPSSITADLPADYAQRYFLSSDDGRTLTVAKEIRERVVVARQDILVDPPFSRLDLVMCRNFLIYLEPEAQEKCIALFHYALKDGGALFLGNAETVGRKSALFKSVGRKQCRIYRRIGAPASRLPLSVPYASERAAPQPAPPAVTTGRRAATGLVQEFLLEGYAPAAIAVDQNYDIVYHNGPTNRYLRQPRGVPTQNLLELLPESLRNRIRGAVYRSGQEGKPVAIRASVPGDDGRKRPVALRISKIKENLWAVVFQEKSGAAKPEEASALETGRVEETAIHQLESELAATRQDLQSHIEQLKSLNEELQSSNEELQAANEELETSREELQSLNEELVIVNSQLQTKIEEQDETNNDLNNFLASTNIPTMFLDHQFKVKRFTPAMLRLIKLLPSDVGRPIVDMSQEHLGPDLIVDAQTVLESLVPIRKELHINGTWYVRATLPYRTSDSRIAGVVVTYSDVTELKTAQAHTGHLAALVESADDAIISKDPGGVIRTWNVGAEKTFGYTAAEAVGRNISFLVPPGHVDEVPGIIRRILLGEHIEHFESLRMRKDGTVIPVSLTYSAIRDANGKITGVSKIAHDITERKNHEQMLARQASLLDLSLDAIVVRDAGDRVVYWNDGASKLYGYTREEGMGRVTHELLRTEFPEPLKRIEEKLRHEGVWSGELVHRRRDGARIIVSSRWVLSRDENGAATVLETNTDITERRKAEDALRESEEKLRLFIEYAPAALAMFDRDMRYVSYSRRWMSDYGLGDRDLRGLSHYEVFPEISERWKEVHRRGLAGEVVRSDNDRFERADGSVQWLQWEVRPWHEASGGTAGIVIFSEDVTARKKAEDEILRAKEDWEQTFNTVPDLIALLDCNHQVIRVNKAMADRLGLAPEQCAGARCYEAVHGTDEPVSFCPHTLTCKDGKEHIAEVREPRLGGDFLVSTNPMFDASGKVVGSVHVARDITERKKTEAQLLQLTEEMAARNLELEALNKELEAFNYSVSHDLRAPLRTVAGFSRVLIEERRNELDDQCRDYLGRIASASEKMTQLINDLMRLSHISRQPIERMDIDLSALAEAAVSGLREASPERNVEVDIRPDVRASADLNLMRVVMTDLMENAWKFTSKTERATIEFGAFGRETRGAKPETVYYLRDNGAGFDQQYAGKMFLPFHRLHTEEEFEGTGIGLAIVERIVRRHGGKIWAEGKTGKGATVFFTLG